MTWRVVHIKESEHMKLKLDNLEIKKQGMTYFIALSDISMVILEGNDTVITSRLLSEMSKHNITVVICDQKYLPTGLYLSYGTYHRAAKRTQQQVLWPEDLKKAAWKKIIEQKIHNQIQFARYQEVDEQRILVMTDLYNEVLPGDETNREGHVAKVYFNSLYGLEFTRDDYCIENIAMNFGYTIVRSAVARMVVGQGLMTMLGIFHRNEYNTFNLVDDLMEPFRPLMDAWIHQEVLGKEEYLSYELRLKIIDFMNQPMRYKNTKSSVDQVMQKYINSFVKAMEKNDTNEIISVKLEDFIRKEK